jgi:hypothetical protein
VEELAACAGNLALIPERVRQYAETLFSRDRMVNDYIELYSEILGETYHTEAEPIVA